MTSEMRWTVAAVARRLGVAPATLRTWDRRYGIGPSDHQPGEHRHYTPDDLARLQEMRRLTVAGMTPAAAARSVLTAPLSGQPDHRGPAPELIAKQSGGGRAMAMPGAPADTRGMARAAMTLDGHAVIGTVRRSLRERGVVATWDELVEPVLRAVGQRWEATGQGIDVEHLLAESVLAALRTLPTGEPTEPAAVLLACADGDLHSLPLHVLALALAERGIATRNLGAAVPGEALADAVRRVGPAVVFLWSSLRETGDPAYLASVPTTMPAASVLLGGPGWRLEELPPGATVSRDLVHALELVDERLGR